MILLNKPYIIYWLCRLFILFTSWSWIICWISNS